MQRGRRVAYAQSDDRPDDHRRRPGHIRSVDLKANARELGVGRSQPGNRLGQGEPNQAHADRRTATNESNCRVHLGQSVIEIFIRRLELAWKRSRLAVFHVFTVARLPRGRPLAKPLRPSTRTQRCGRSASAIR